MLVGVSGGSDSVALAVVLRELATHGEFTVAALAHFNHQLRESAARDEAFARSLAERFALPILVEACDVGAEAAAQRRSIEDTARRVRYAFLERAADAVGADRIAVGHTQDDQAETLLLKLMRGAGSTGLAGIYPRRGNVIRPLLDVSRDDLRSLLRSQGQAWVDDESNDDLENPRNRLRHVVIPELDRTAGGATRPALARAAELVREDGQWLDEVSRQRFDALATDTQNGVEFDARLLKVEPAPVLRRLLLTALRRHAGLREVGLEHVESVLALLDGSGGGVDVPGGRVELLRGKLVLIEKGGSK